MTTESRQLRLAVIIVSYQVRDLLAPCLKSVIADQAAVIRDPRTGDRPLVTETWVVDNASTDGSAEMVRRRFPQVHLIANDDNRGFAAANNQVLRQLISLNRAGAANNDAPDHVLLLNPDTEVRRDALELLVAHLEQNPGVGAAGPALIYPDGRFQHSAFAFPGLAQLSLDLFPIHGRISTSRLNGRYPRSRYATGKPFEIDHPLGAALMVRRQAIEQVGLLDEAFFMYGEEVDWCWRIKQAGWAIHCVPHAQIVHHEGRSTAQFREAMFVALWRSRRRLYARHHGPLTNWLAHRIVRAGIARQARQQKACAAHTELAEAAWRAQQRAYERVLEIWA